MGIVIKIPMKPVLWC